MNGPGRDPRPASVEVLGVPLLDGSLGLALAWLRAWLAGSSGRAIYTVNPEFIVAAHRDPKFLSVLRRSDVNLIDGIGLLAATRMSGHLRPQRCAGVDLIPHVSRLCAAQGRSLFLLGGRAGAAAMAAETLLRDCPGLQIAGTAEPLDPFGEADELCRTIAMSGAGALLVAFGTPRQEYWIDQHREKCSVAIAIGVGGAFDFLAGRSRRAPLWMRRVGLEWLFRLASEPWRWRRQLALPVFAWMALRAAIRRRR